MVMNMLNSIKNGVIRIRGTSGESLGKFNIKGIDDQMWKEFPNLDLDDIKQQFANQIAEGKFDEMQTVEMTRKKRMFPSNQQWSMIANMIEDIGSQTRAFLGVKALSQVALYKTCFMMATLTDPSEMCKFLTAYFKRVRPEGVTNKKCKLIVSKFKNLKFNPGTMLEGVKFLYKIRDSMLKIKSVHDAMNLHSIVNVDDAEHFYNIMPDLIADMNKYANRLAAYSIAIGGTIASDVPPEACDMLLGENSARTEFGEQFDLLCKDQLGETFNIDEAVNIVTSQLNLVSELLIVEYTKLSEKDMAGSTWTTEIVEGLRKGIKAKIGFEELSRKLFRTEASILSQVIKMRHEGEFIYLPQLPTRGWLPYDDKFMESILRKYEMYQVNTFNPKIVKRISELTGRRDISIIAKIYKINQDFTNLKQSDFITTYIDYLKDRLVSLDAKKSTPRVEYQTKEVEVEKIVHRNIPIPAYYMIPGEPEIIRQTIPLTKEDFSDKLTNWILESGLNERERIMILEDHVDIALNGGKKKEAIFKILPHSRNNIQIDKTGLGIMITLVGAS